MCWLLFILNQPAYTAIFKCLYITTLFSLHVEIHITQKASSPIELRNDLSWFQLHSNDFRNRVGRKASACCGFIWRLFFSFSFRERGSLREKAAPTQGTRSYKPRVGLDTISEWKPRTLCCVLGEMRKKGAIKTVDVSSCLCRITTIYGTTAKRKSWAENGNKTKPHRLVDQKRFNTSIKAHGGKKKEKKL